MRAKIVILIVVSAVFLVCLGILFAFNQAVKSPNPNINEATLFEVKSNINAKILSSELKKEGLILNERAFYVLIRVFGKKIKPGYYEITAKMSPLGIANLIDSGKIKLVKITIPEGWRSEQIAARLSANKILEYKDFVEAAKPYEGKLFPDTYLLNPRMRPSEVIMEMLKVYQEKTVSLGVTDATLKLASIVEREAAKDSERALIAGVYSNRLNLGMKLEADPTVQYGKDNNEFGKLTWKEKEDFKFWGPITLAHYTSVVSNFNTYSSVGLPPTPICNPGLNSILAALNPEKHSYLYFLHKDGQIYPSKSVEEHNTNRAKVLGARVNR